MSPDRAATRIVFWFAALLCACGPAPESPRGNAVVTRPNSAGERVDTVLLSHVVGTNLPPWAACYFPDLANPYARRRAGTCPLETQATNKYRAKDLAGCWRVRRPDGGALDLAGFTGPLRLMRGPSAKMRGWGWADDGLRGVQYMSPIPRERMLDTALNVVYWRFVPPDVLDIGVSTGLTGASLTFRVRGDNLVGMLRFGGDVIMHSVDTTSDPVQPLAGKRVRCTLTGANR